MDDKDKKESDQGPKDIFTEDHHWGAKRICRVGGVILVCLFCVLGIYFYALDRVDLHGEVTLQVPKLRKLPFETAIIERYRRREESVEEALIEMYLAGVSVRRVEDITEALWGTKVSPGTISHLNQKVYAQIEEWRKRELKDEYPYVYLDGIYLKKNWGGTIENVAILIAIGVNSEGNREIIGAAEGGKEDKESWLRFLRHLKGRGLRGTRLMVGDKCMGLTEAIKEVYPETKYQRCMVHFMRNILCDVPRSRAKEVGTWLKAIFAQEDQEASLKKAGEIAKKLILPELKTVKNITCGERIRLIYNGESSFTPLLSNIILSCGVPLNILHAETKDIYGKAYGEMILQLPEDSRSAARVKNYLNANNITYSVLEGGGKNVGNTSQAVG